jgi:hypothetical protein
MLTARPRLSVLAMAALAFLSACAQDAKETGDIAETPSAATSACPRPADPEAYLAELEATEARLIEAAKASRGSGHPELWTMKDEDTTLYIMGTVHLLRPDLQWRTPEIDAAIAAADTVVFEVDTTSEAAGRELMSFSVKEGLFSDGTQLNSLLTEAEVGDLKVALDSVGLPIEAVQSMKPWFAAINLSVMQLTQEGFDPKAGVEQSIEADARAHGAGFDYLETVELQLGEFARLDMCSQVNFLMQSAASVQQGTEMLDLLVAEWADGDVNGLGILMGSADSFGSQAAYDAMLKNRNTRWVPKIAAMLDEPGTKLVAAGAGHFAGPDSVIGMLRADGYEVEGP